MTMEEGVFRAKRFLPEKLASYGFERTDGGYRFAGALLGGDFDVILFVSDAGELTGRVIDRMNDEEYAPLRSEVYTGAYVASVRKAYEELLQSVAGACCINAPFTFEQSNRITAAVEERFGVKPDFPFGESVYEPCGVFRHKDNRKWFGLIMNLPRKAILKDRDNRRVEVINLKIDPADAPALHAQTGIFPAYHMNHQSWITVLLDGTLDDESILRLIARSCALTAGKRKS